MSKPRRFWKRSQVEELVQMVLEGKEIKDKPQKFGVPESTMYKMLRDLGIDTKRKKLLDGTVHWERVLFASEETPMLQGGQPAGRWTVEYLPPVTEKSQILGKSFTSVKTGMKYQIRKVHGGYVKDVKDKPVPGVDWFMVNMRPYKTFEYAYGMMLWTLSGGETPLPEYKRS